MNKVSVVIINYNSSEYSIECIRSILHYTPADFSFEIILVDNNSRSSDFEKLKVAVAAYNCVILLRSSINLGFSGGNMLGAKNASAEYVYFLNNDCVLLNDNLNILYNFMLANRDAGICTGQMYSGDKTPHHSFDYFPDLKTKVFGSSILRLFKPADYPSLKIKYTAALKVPMVTGAAMFVNSKIFRETGGFDTNFFLYCEEEDFCYRLKRSGYSAYLVPAAEFIHYMGKSTRRNFDFEYENYISLVYFFRKHNSYLGYTILKVIYAFKIFKKFYRNLEYIKLSYFILKGAPMQSSMRFKQG
jgi:GT2 family glycosyltransferase